MSERYFYGLRKGKIGTWYGDDMVSPQDCVDRLNELERLQEKAYQMLEMCGVPKARSRTVSNGINVLCIRTEKENAALHRQLAEQYAPIIKLIDKRIVEGLMDRECVVEARKKEVYELGIAVNKSLKQAILELIPPKETTDD